MRKLLALLIVLMMMGFSGAVNAAGKEINEEYAYNIVHLWAEDLPGGTCKETMAKLEGLNDEDLLQLRELVDADQQMTEHNKIAISTLDKRYAAALVNHIDSMRGKLVYDKAVDAKLVEPVASGTVIWYKVETLEGVELGELFMGIPVKPDCDFVRELGTPYKLYLQGQEIIKLEELKE